MQCKGVCIVAENMVGIYIVSSTTITQCIFPIDFGIILWDT